MRLTRQFVAPVAICLSILAAGCGGGGSEPTVGPPASISPLSGSSSTVVAGTTAPIALVAKVLDASGRAVPGAGVTWGTTSGAISPAAATTDGSGQATAQWTPGRVAGAQTATASVSGAGSATFSATVTPAALAQIKLLPDTTKLGAAGSTAQLSATGLDAFDNTVPGFSPTYSIDDPTIATVSGTGLLTSVKTGTTTVRATSGSISASAIVMVNATVADPCAGVTMTLGVGGSQTLTGTAASQFCVTGAAGAEFVAIPFFGTGNGGTGSGSTTFTPAPSLSFTVAPLTNIAVSGPPTPDVLSSQVRANVSVSGRVPVRDVAWEARFREKVRKQFSPLIRSVGRTTQARTRARLSLGVSPAVSPGDVLHLNVTLNAACGQPLPDSIVDAPVKAVSRRAIVVEDIRDAGGFSQSDYQFFADQFDNQVWLVDSTNFGPPTDIDENGRVILFFTKAVNALTPQSNNTSFVGGFFYGRDEYYKANTQLQGTFQCPGSNQGEMFYLLAPDPSGQTNGHVRTVDFVKSITIGTVAHEFQHLINFGSHQWINKTLFDNFEETYLDEGLAHVAEELNFYAATGKSPRTNINAASLTADAASYSAYGRQNALRFSDYLKAPDRYPPYSALADTSLSVRGAIWSLLRYATDMRSSSVPEKSTWFDLVNPTKLGSDGFGVTGIENLQAVFGADFISNTMRNWVVANYMDDAGVANTSAVFQHPSWNTRDVETFVNSTFPLKTTNLVASGRSITLADGGAAYLRFGVDAGKVGGGTLNAGSSLPSSFSITVVRTK